jgi:hypothetical protein
MVDVRFSCRTPQYTPNSPPPPNGWEVCFISKSKLFFDRRPVCLGVRHPSVTHDQFFFCYCRTIAVFLLWLVPFLPTWRACNLLVRSLLGRISAVILRASSPAERVTVLSWDSPNLKDQVPIFPTDLPTYTPHLRDSLFVASWVAGLRYRYTLLTSFWTLSLPRPLLMA